MNEQHFDALPPVNMNELPEAQAAQGGEAKSSPAEQPGSSAPAPAAMTPMVDPAAAPAASDPVAASMATAAVPAIADDVDLIEKEWVEKAKHIVEQTKQDPYKQNEEITKMKLDYLKKRYNRDIKSGEKAA